ncbi:MAG: hypothetical protein L3V56_13675 [Candidatus Magnetoovum sp. WYHC-5]|nr:hypothetical protein [Candidatus Magnetoovum sp. WYHC-5]
MLKIDAHVHTYPHSVCSTMPPERAINAAINASIDGIIITEHDYLWVEAEIERLCLYNDGKLRRLFFGAEVNCKEGHFLVFGLKNLDNIYFSMPAAELIKIAHKKGAAVIVAHPYRFDNEQGDSCYKLDIDGVEVNSSNTYATAERLAHKLADEKGIFKLISSDAHAVDVLGSYYTSFPDSIDSVEAFAGYILNAK